MDLTHDEGCCPGCNEPTNNASEEPCAECVANGAPFLGFYVRPPVSTERFEAYRAWTQAQKDAGRTDITETEVGRGILVAAEYPKPKHPSAQEAA